MNDSEAQLKTEGDSKRDARRWWITTLIAVLAIAIPFFGWKYSLFPEGGGEGGDESPMPGASAGTAGSSAVTLYLKDLSPAAFTTPQHSISKGPVRSGHEDFPSSYYFQFRNCNDCTSNIDVNVPEDSKTFMGTLALADKTRTDGSYDGTVYFSVATPEGQVLLEPQRVRHPTTVPFDISINGHSRLRLIVSSGGNEEYPCWCDARFVH